MTTAASSSQELPQRQMLQFKLESRDGVIVEVDEDVALMSGLLKQMIGGLGITGLEEPIPLNNLDGWTLKKILERCTAHRGEVFRPKAANEHQRTILTQEDLRYLDVNEQQMKDMLNAANFLDVPGVLDIMCQFIANMAIGKSVAEIRDTYGFPHDLSAEEEEKLARRFEFVEM